MEVYDVLIGIATFICGAGANTLFKFKHEKNNIRLEYVDTFKTLDNRINELTQENINFRKQININEDRILELEQENNRLKKEAIENSNIILGLQQEILDLKEQIDAIKKKIE